MKKSSIFDDKRVILVMALVLAAISWIVIAGFINPGRSREIENVPIDYERNAQQYKDMNLQIVGGLEEAFANVQVEGDSTIIGSLGTESVLVYADYSKVTGAGLFSVPVYTEKVASGSYNVTNWTVKAEGYTVSRPKKNVDITFAEVATKTIPIAVKADGVTATSGFFKDTPTADPIEVVVSGPKARVEQIAQAVATVVHEEELDETKKYTGVPVQLLDANGNELNAEELGLTLSAATVSVDVPILLLQTIQLDISFVNVPEYFDMDWLKSQISLTPDTLQVVGGLAAFEHLEDPYSIQTFDLNQLAIGWESEPINITLPEGLRNHDELRQVVARLNTTDMVERTIEVTNMRVRNAPSNATVTPVGDSMSVKLIGPKDQVEALLADNIEVQFDASGVSVNRDSQQSVPARIRIPSADRVIPIGEYTMVCNIVIN